MEEDYKVCRNKSCKRQGIIVETAQRKPKCDSCGHKLTHVTDSRRSWSDKLFNDGPARPGNSGASYLPAWYQDKSKQDTWTRPADITGCPLIKSDISLLKLPMELYHTWIYLAKEFRTEWLAYLNGSKDETTGVYTITDMYIPKQLASGGHCQSLEGEVKPDTIGCVHSHVDFGTFFSQEDKDHFNHPVEIVINRSGSLLYAARYKLKCGNWSRIESRNWNWVGDEKMLEIAIELEGKIELESSKVQLTAS